MYNGYFVCVDNMGCDVPLSKSRTLHMKTLFYLQFLVSVDVFVLERERACKVAQEHTYIDTECYLNTFYVT